MRILYICEFSYPSICGVWSRVYSLSKEMLKKGHEVHVFSSNIIKGTGKISEPYEAYEGIHIHRFPVNFSLGENALFWDFKNELLKLSPDVIDAQVYRHPHTNSIPRLARKIGAKCILTTHAPFVDKSLRNWKLNTAVSLYDSLIGKRVINSYDLVLAITRWEIPYLLKLGCRKNKIIYSPNGIPEEFFKSKPKSGNKNKILFLGRIAPIKNIEVLIKALKIVNNPSIRLDLIGPAESNYKKKLVEMILDLKLEKQIKFVNPIYNLKKKIKAIDAASIFVLPSKREAMPQSLIEAMSRGKICISSDTEGGKEIIKDEANGFIFKNGDERELAENIKYCIKNSSKLGNIRKNALQLSKKFNWKILSKEIEKIYSKA